MCSLLGSILAAVFGFTTSQQTLSVDVDPLATELQ
jgi:hypothetical protein